MTNPDYQPLTLRRVALISERLDMVYAAIHVSMVVIFIGVLAALYIVREDILAAIERK
jgi:hypothetical protein